MLMKTTFAQAGGVRKGTKEPIIIQYSQSFKCGRYVLLNQEFIAGVSLGLDSRTRGQ